jgi:hypothetical protein
MILDDDQYIQYMVLPTEAMSDFVEESVIRTKAHIDENDRWPYRRLDGPLSVDDLVNLESALDALDTVFHANCDNPPNGWDANAEQARNDRFNALASELGFSGH